MAYSGINGLVVQQALSWVACTTLQTQVIYTGYHYSSGAVNYNFFGDLSMLFYLVNAVIIGYMAGALNNGSTNFKRMLGAGLTAAIITAVIQLFMNYNFTCTAYGHALGSKHPELTRIARFNSSFQALL